jgi:hypothetical protein
MTRPPEAAKSPDQADEARMRTERMMKKLHDLKNRY